MTLHRAAAPLALALILGAVLAAPATAASIEYLYVDASEGGGSGGHAAVLIGDRVFHFEHRAPGLLRLAREPFEAVRRRYALEENRTIELLRIGVSDETRELILEEFTRRHLVQTQHLEDHQALVDDRRLLEAVLDSRSGAATRTLSLEGAGFFVDELAPSGTAFAPTDTAPALVRLRERVEQLHGPAFVTDSSARIRAELGALEPDGTAAVAGPLAADRLTATPGGLARRHRDAVLALVALESLAEARPLTPGSLAEVDPDAFALDDGELTVVRRLASALELSLGRLAASPRADRGFALLLGMARLIALDETIRTGRWSVLDAWRAGDGPVIARDRLLGEPGLARALRERARARFRSAAGRVGRTADEVHFPEAEFARLEAAANQLAEIERAFRNRRDVHIGAGGRPPARTAAYREPSLPAMDLERLRDALATARLRETSHAIELKRLYGYDLFRRNCATELFRTIAAALARDAVARDPRLTGAELAARVASDSTERLGGYVDADGGLTFIPAASASAVRARYAVVDVVEIPSYRRAAVAAMSARGMALGAVIRESNTVTSTLYRWTPEDSAFFFFTDDLRAARPLLGAVNLLVGLGATAAGLAMLPVDRGETLMAGVRGALWSVPELAFFNIRKGRFADAPWRAGGPAAGRAE